MYSGGRPARARRENVDEIVVGAVGEDGSGCVGAYAVDGVEAGVGILDRLDWRDVSA